MACRHRPWSKRRRQDAGDQRRLQWQVRGRDGSGCEKGQAEGFQLSTLPVFSNLIKPDPGMPAYIDGVREPYQDRLKEKLATAEEMLFRRGNFNGTFDQVICDALIKVHDAHQAVSRFPLGNHVLPGQPITMENVLDQTCITYPETYRREMTGAEFRAILEDVGDNLFNPDP